jgi:hypothetical protein
MKKSSVGLGDLKGFYAVTVRANWRLIDRFENGNLQNALTPLHRSEWYC